MELRMLGPGYRDEVVYICEHMRDMDHAEVFCTTDIESCEAYADFLIRLTEFNTTGWIALIDGEPVALVAVSLVRKGVASVCMFATDSFDKIALSMTKFIKRDMIPQFVKHAGIRRAQCFSMNGHVVAHSWLRVLGAESEGVARGYGKNGEDFTLFSWRF